MLKKIFLFIFIAVGAFALYQTIGYIIFASRAPIFVSTSGKTIFTGMYLFSIVYGALFFICLIGATICLVKIKKVKNKITQ